MTEKQNGQQPSKPFGRHAHAILAGLTAAFAVPFGLLIFAVITDRPAIADAVAPWLMPVGVGLLLILVVLAAFSGKGEP